MTMWIRKDGFAQLINLEKMKDKPESRDPLNLKLPVVHTKILSTWYIPREQFLTPPPPINFINFVHGSYRKCLTLT